MHTVENTKQEKQLFDIYEYYNEEPRQNPEQAIPGFEEDLEFTIDSILEPGPDSIYHKDRFKYRNKVIDILYPKLAYPGKQVLITPDRVRFLLSFYPMKSDFAHLNRIIIMPRHVEINDVELAALYLRKKRTLVFYLTHPHFYRMSEESFNGLPRFKPVDLQGLFETKTTSSPVSGTEEKHLMVHPIWYFLSVIESSGENIIDKFLIKQQSSNSTIYEILRDISYYYSSRGY